MNLQIIADKLELDKKIYKNIKTKIADKVDRLLSKFDFDIKKATMRISKRSRWGYKINFDMMLPHRQHIYAQEIHEDLIVAIKNLQKEVLRQIERYKEKLQRK